MNRIYLLSLLMSFSSNALYKESETKVFVQLVRVTKLDPTLKQMLRTIYPIIFIEKTKINPLKAIKLP